MPLATKKSHLRFSSFTLDSERRILLHADVPVSLTAKQFDVLEYMVLNPGRILTKQEILQAVWPDSFVEEGSLSQNVFWLRKALRNGSPNDGQEHYIVTVQGRGYRFVADVLGDAEDQAQAEPFATVSQPLNGPESPLASPSHIQNRKTLYLVVAASLLLLTAASGVLWQRHRLSHKFYDPIANPEVIIVGIQNATGDASLTPALNGILRRGISQSPFVVIVPRSEINKTLGYMNLPLTTAITPENAQSICLRRNSTAIIETSIVPQASGFLLTLEAKNCVTGKSQSVGRATTTSKDQILVALDSLLPQLRRDLGESSTSVRQFAVPVENATTSSLEAFKAFLAGEDLRMKGETVKAIPLFQRALQLDPNFAFAHLALGTCYQTSNERDASIAEFKRAYELASRISPRERFSVEFFYVKIVQGDQRAALVLNDAWEKRYPRDMAPYTNGTDSLNQLDRYNEAIKHGELGIQRFPEGGLTYVALGQAYLRAGRFADMRRIGDQAIALKVDGWQLHELLWQWALLTGDEKAAAAERAWVTGTSDEYLAMGDDVLVALQRGQMKQAIAAQKRFTTAALALSAKDAVDTSVGRLAFYEQELGLSDEARARLNTWHATNPTPEIALALANAGETQPTQALLAALYKDHEQDTLANQWYLPNIRGALALHGGGDAAGQRALDALRGSEPLDLHDFTASYLRGKANLQLKHGADARAAFQHIVDNPGADPFSPLYPLALLGLARAQVMSGDLAASRVTYERLLKQWQNADSTLPALVEAKRELANLH